MKQFHPKFAEAMEECFGPMPEPHGYSDEGEPLYSTAQVHQLTR